MEVAFDVTLVDGGWLLQSQMASMKRIRNYGHVAETILAYVMRLNTEEIHVLLDTYKDDSLKYQERQRREADDRAYVIANAELKPSMSTDALMRNNSFKQELCKFLQTEWAKVEFRRYIGQKNLCLTRRSMH